MLFTFSAFSVAVLVSSGESSMPRVQMPLIVGQGGGLYHIIARIYDILQDYTEVATEVYVSLPVMCTYPALI